jgi:hypothetical protein
MREDFEVHQVAKTILVQRVLEFLATALVFSVIFFMFPSLAYPEHVKNSLFEIILQVFYLLLLYYSVFLYLVFSSAFALFVLKRIKISPVSYALATLGFSVLFNGVLCAVFLSLADLNFLSIVIGLSLIQAACAFAVLAVGFGDQSTG